MHPLSAEFPDDRGMAQVWFPRHNQLPIDDFIAQERLFREPFEVFRLPAVTADNRGLHCPPPANAAEWASTLTVIRSFQV